MNEILYAAVLSFFTALFVMWLLKLTKRRPFTVSYTAFLFALFFGFNLLWRAIKPLL